MDDSQNINETAYARCALTDMFGFSERRVLDSCCGSRMFWFDRKNPEAVFLDQRRESHVLPDKSSTGGSRTLVVDPDIKADFSALPFSDNRFALVVFDPPHLVRNGKKGWLAKKYGKLEGDWKEQLRQGFAECFRVLKPDGTLIFKWNEHEVPVSQILALTPEKPLVGNRCGKTAKSHWIVYMKPNPPPTKLCLGQLNQNKQKYGERNGGI